MAYLAKRIRLPWMKGTTVIRNTAKRTIVGDKGSVNNSQESLKTFPTAVVRDNPMKTAKIADSILTASFLRTLFVSSVKLEPEPSLRNLYNNQNASDTPAKNKMFIMTGE